MPTLMVMVVMMSAMVIAVMSAALVVRIVTRGDGGGGDGCDEMGYRGGG